MAQRIIFETLESLTHEELLDAVVVAVKKKNKKLSRRKDLQIHFRWGEPMDNIFATADIVKDIQEIEET